MIDIHSHILPGVDDGAPSMEASLELARAAVAAGTQIMVATPHVRGDYPLDPATIAERVDAVNLKLVAEGVELRVVAGAEVSLSKAVELERSELRALCLGSGSYILVESPYTNTVADIEGIFFDLQVAGLTPLLAHPERCPVFQNEPERLARLVDAGALCSITSGSLAGRFGSTVRRFALRLVSEGLVHDVASDSHDAVRRPPDLLPGFASADTELPGFAEQASWYTVTAPVAMLAGKPLPARPEPPQLKRSTLKRLFGAR